MLSQAAKSFSRGVQRSAVNAARPTVAGPLSTSVRSYGVLDNQIRDQKFLEKSVQSYHDQLLGLNWGDYLELVLNDCFLKVHLGEITQAYATTGYTLEEGVQEKLDYIHKATDCMYACEDVRDHTNEILELMTRKTGILGMGINAGEDIDNMDEQCVMLVKEYQRLLKDFPEFKPKIEQCVGHGLAILRMKYKFQFEGGHRFFY